MPGESQIQGVGIRLYPLLSTEGRRSSWSLGRPGGLSQVKAARLWADGVPEGAATAVNVCLEFGKSPVRLTQDLEGGPK